MLARLAAALAADPSAVAFADTARSLRRDGVFEEDFALFLDRSAAARPEGEERGAVMKILIRLSNPYLRQPGIDEL